MSDILLPETAEQMQVQRPGTQIITVPNVGHAPALMDDAQIQPIKQWLCTQP